MTGAIYLQFGKPKLHWKSEEARRDRKEPPDRVHQNDDEERPKGLTGESGGDEEGPQGLTGEQDGDEKGPQGLTGEPEDVVGQGRRP
jgi:hypothetical protein